MKWLLRNDMDGSNSRADWNVAFSAFHRDYQTEIRKRRFRLDFRLIAALHVYDLAELGEFVVRRDRPKGEPLARRRFLQVVETHVDLSRSVFPRRNENIRAGAGQRTSEFYFDFSVIAFFVRRDI